MTAGYYGYGWNGYGYTPGNIAQLTQLGYPVALDGGLLMERSDSYGYGDGGFSNNTVIGSLQTGWIEWRTVAGELRCQAGAVGHRFWRGS